MSFKSEQGGGSSNGIAAIFMKKILLYVIILLVGVVIGWMSGTNHSREIGQDIERDTVCIYKTVPYSKPQLSANTLRLYLPKIDNPSLVFIREDSTSIIYRDSIKYVTLPRQYFYTKVKDAEIWHSGIDSSIDSLNVFTSNTIFAEVIKNTPKKNAVSAGIEVNYLNTFSIPIYLEYERMLHKNVGIYGQINYDLQTKMFGVGIGAKVSIGW